jgi:hypothetical protein
MPNRKGEQTLRFQAGGVVRSRSSKNERVLRRGDDFGVAFAEREPTRPKKLRRA